MRIFTHSIISPGLSLRQCPSRCTFRAGRNLPDKEFRYLRTVIVTAAVYWGFGSMLRLTPNKSPYPSSTGQVSAPILRLFGFAETYVFAKQSLGPVHCGSSYKEHPFSRSYGVILPSSLTRVLPLTFGFSPRLPVSVSGTSTGYLTRGFSRQCEIWNFGTIVPSPSQLEIVGRICLSNSLTAWAHTTIRALSISSCVAPSFKRYRGGTGISTCYPSPTPFGLSLGPDLP